MKRLKNLPIKGQGKKLTKEAEKWVAELAQKIVSNLPPRDTLKTMKNFKRLSN